MINVVLVNFGFSWVNLGMVVVVIFISIGNILNRLLIGVVIYNECCMVFLFLVDIVVCMFCWFMDWENIIENMVVRVKFMSKLGLLRIDNLKVLLWFL